STTYYYQVSVTGPNRKTATSATGTFATPAPDLTAPTISDVAMSPLPDGTAAVGWQTDENADSTLLIGAAPDALGARHDGRTDDTHTVGLAGLRPNSTYYYRVQSVDAAGNATVWPAPADPPARFVSAANGVGDRTAQQFRMSASATGTYLRGDDLGAVS